MKPDADFKLQANSKTIKLSWLFGIRWFLTGAEHVWKIFPQTSTRTSKWVDIINPVIMSPDRCHLISYTVCLYQLITS